MTKLRAFDLNRLITCDERLQKVVLEAIKTWNTEVRIICGTRSEAEQNKAFANGASKLKYPHSKHNSNPSKAVDMIPMAAGGIIDWNNHILINTFAAHIKETAKKLDIPIVWGGDWKFKDKVHFELTN